MIKCWDASGKLVDTSKLFTAEDNDMSEVTTQLIPLLSYISQKAKVIITKVQIEDDTLNLVIEQK